MNKQTIKLVLVSLLAVMLPGLIRAASVTLTNADASAATYLTSSFTSKGYWNASTAPNTSNDYFTSVYGLRTPQDTTNYTFQGNSLTLQTPSTTTYSIIDKDTVGSGSTATYVINNLTMSGGLIRSGGTVGHSCIITGNVLNVTANSTITSDQVNWIINSPLTGSGILTNNYANSQITTYGGTNSAFAGKFLINGVVLFSTQAAVPGNPLLPIPDQIILGSGGTLRDNIGIQLTNSNSGITLNGAGTINTVNAGTNTVIAEPITGAFTLTKSGAGTLTLSGSNSMTGMTLSGATAGSQLNLNSTNALGTGTFTINSGDLATLNNTSGSPLTNLANNAQSWANNFTFSGSNNLNLGTGAVTMTAARSITNLAGVLTVGGNISGAYTLTKAGNGTLVLAGANTHINTTLTAGTVVMAGPSALGTNGLTFSGTNALLDIATDGSDTAYVVNAGSGTIFTLASDVNTGSVGINHTLGTFSIGSGATLTMNIIKGPNVASGSPKITTGALTLSGGAGGTTLLNPTTADLVIPSVTSVSGNKTLQLDGTGTGSAITGVLGQGTNVVTVVKTGASTWTLGGVNTYTGTTTISNGTLLATGSLGSNTVTVAGGTLALSGSGTFSNGTAVVLGSAGTLNVSAATGFALGSSSTLAGSGAVSGNFADSAGSQILPGGSGAIGVLTFNSNLTLAGGDTIKFDFSSSTNDLVVVGGNLVPNGVTTINLASLPGGAYLPAGDYVLITVTGTLGGSAASFTVTGAPSPSRQNFSVVYSDNNVVLHVTGSNAGLVWQGGLNGNLWDTTTLNWLNGATSDSFYNGDNANFTDAGAANPPVLNMTVYPSQVNFNSSSSYTLSGTGKVSGGASLTQSGSGTLTLTITNDYTGVTTLAGGAVMVNALANGGVASPLGAASSAPANLVFNGGTLQYAGTTGASTDHGATLGAGGGTLALGGSGNPVTVAGAIVGTSGGVLTKTGNDALILSGTNHYDGATVIGAGILQVGTGGTTGNLGAGAITDNGSLVVNRNGTLILTNVISGTGSLTNNGPGTLVLGPTNTFAGGLVINTGLVQVATATALGATPAAFNPAIITLNAGELEATASFTLNDTHSGITMQAGIIGVDTNATVTIANPIVSTVSLTKSGPGTLILSGTNSLAGTLYVDTASATGSDGVLDITSLNALGGVTNISIRNNQVAGSSTLQLDGTAGGFEVTNPFAWSGRNNLVPALQNIAGDNLWDPASVTFNSGGTYYVIQCDAGSLTVSNTVTFPTTAPAASRNLVFAGNGNIAIAGTIQSGGCTNLSVIKTNSGALTFWGNNTYNGLTSVQGGTLNAADGSLFGNSTVNGNIEIAPLTNEVATLNISNAFITAQRVIIAGITANSGTPGTGTLNQTGGSLDAYQWFTVGSGGASGGTGTYNLSGGTLNVHGQQMEVANFTASVGTVNLSGYPAINIWSNNYITLGANPNAGNGTFNQGGGTVRFYSDSGGTVGGTGCLYLGRASGLTNTYAYWLNGGTLTVPTITSVSGNSQFYFNGGTLQAASTNTAFMSGLTAANVSTNGAIIDSASCPVTITQPLVHDPALGAAADGGLTSQSSYGTGALTLAGTNTYTGPTVVNSGTLLVSGSIAGSGVTVNGGTLGGTGTINSAVTISGGTLTPAGVATIGTLAVNNSLTVQSGTLRFDLTKTNNDVLNVSGAVNVTGGGTVLLNFPAPAPGVYTLVSYGSLSGFANLTASLTSPNPRFTCVLTNDTTAKAIKVVFTGVSANLTWRGDGSFNGWDNTGSYPNWIKGAAADYFYDGDAVTFDNTGSNTPSIYLLNTLSPGSVVVDSTNDYDFAGYGTVTSTGTLTKNNTGKLTLEVDNTYVAVTLNAGTVQIGNGSSSGSLTSSSGVITNNGSLVYDRSDAIVLPSQIYGSGSLTLNGSGAVTASGSNYYTGPTYINNSSIAFLTASSALGATNGGISVASGAQLYITANVDVGPKPLALTGTGDGNGALRKGGAGTTTYNGNVTLAGNTLLTVDGSATLNLASSNGISGAAANASLTLGGSGSGVFAGPLALGSGGLTVSGGSWTLAPSNNFTGLTAVNGGTLRVTGGSIGNPTMFTPNQITLAGGALEAVTNAVFSDGMAGFTLAANNTNVIVDSGATLIISNEITGTANLTKTGAGTLVLATSNSFSGNLYVDTGSTSANDGVTRLTSSNAVAGVSVIPGTATIVQRDNNSGYSILQLDGSLGSFALAQEIQTSCRNTAIANIENIAGSNTLSGNIDVQSGGGSIYLQSDSGTLNIAGSLQYVGTLPAGRTYYFTGAGNHVVSGGITAGVNTNSPISIVMSGTGTLTLSADNPYGGSTTISNGVVLLTGSITSSNGVSVAGGALGGTGTINDKVSVLAGGTLSPGSGLGSIGTLTINSNLTIAGTVAVDINRSTGARDQVVGLTSANYGGTLAVTNLAGTLTTNDTFHLFTVSGTVSGNFTNIVGTPGTGMVFSFNPTNGVLGVVAGTVIPKNPTNITATVSGSTLTLTWPSDHTGWILQAQTNSLASGLGTNWVDVAGSASNNTNVITVNPSSPSVFFRLRYPQ